MSAVRVDEYPDGPALAVFSVEVGRPDFRAFELQKAASLAEVLHANSRA